MTRFRRGCRNGVVASRQIIDRLSSSDILVRKIILFLIAIQFNQLKLQFCFSFNSTKTGIF